MATCKQLTKSCPSMVELSRNLSWRLLPSCGCTTSCCGKTCRKRNRFEALEGIDSPNSGNSACFSTITKFKGILKVLPSPSRSTESNTNKSTLINAFCLLQMGLTSSAHHFPNIILMPFWYHVFPIPKKTRHTGCPPPPTCELTDEASGLELSFITDVFLGSHEMSWMYLSMSILHRSFEELRNSSQWQLSSEFVTKSLELCDGCWDWAPVMVQAVQKQRVEMNEWIAPHRWMYPFVDVCYFDALVFPAMCHGGIVSQRCEQQMEEQYSAPRWWLVAPELLSIITFWKTYDYTEYCRHNYTGVTCSFSWTRQAYYASYLFLVIQFSPRVKINEFLSQHPVLPANKHLASTKDWRFLQHSILSRATHWDWRSKW